MDSQFSVLLFSKYSDNCKKLFEYIKASKIDENILAQKLKLLCIDNENLREIISSDDKLEIKVVPTILSVYANGSVEKFEADHVFSWINNLINNLNPNPNPNLNSNPNLNPNQGIYQSESSINQNFTPNKLSGQEKKQKRVKEISELSESSDNEEDLKNLNNLRKTQKKSEINNISSKQPNKTTLNYIDTNIKKSKKNRKIIRNDDSEESFDTKRDESFNDDRHKTIPPPPRIRKDESGEYIEDSSLFSDEILENRSQPSNVIRSSDKVNESSIASRAKSILKERDNIEQEINVRPIEVSRRP